MRWPRPRQGATLARLSPPAQPGPSPGVGRPVIGVGAVGTVPVVVALHRKSRRVQDGIHVAPVQNGEARCAGQETEVQFGRDLTAGSERVMRVGIRQLGVRILAV